jgi:hypothetical protein
LFTTDEPERTVNEKSEAEYSNEISCMSGYLLMLILPDGFLATTNIDLDTSVLLFALTFAVTKKQKYEYFTYGLIRSH